MLVQREYNENSIKVLSPLEGVRQKISMYAGEKSNNSYIHAVKELINNSLDEYLSGYGKKIVVELDTQTNTISVLDEGRGIPFGSIITAFTQTHSSGKFDKGENTAYQTAGGLNGVGSLLSVALGKQVDVYSYRNNEQCHVRFNFLEHSEPVVTKMRHPNGTKVVFTPQEGIGIDDATLYPEKIRELVKDLSYPVVDVVFELIIDGKKEIYCSKSITQFLEDNVKAENMLTDIFPFKAEQDGVSIEGALVWALGENYEKSFVNLIPTKNGGTHITAMRSTITRIVNKELGLDLKGEDIRKNLSYILSIKTTQDAIFSGQSKDVLAMPELNAPISQLLSPQITIMVNSNKKFFIKLAETIEKQRQRELVTSQIREVLIKSKTKANPIPTKLKPALNSSNAELFICEGDSAAGGLIPQRDVYKHAIMALKGKPINVLKHPLDKVLNNEEIKDLIIAMGGFGEDYNPNKCNYDKIIIMTDSDADGSHIRLLLLSFFFQFYPQLIRDGRIYIVETPLYIIKKGKETQYVFTETEMAKVIPTLPKNAIYTRMKGLGELDPKILAEFAFSENRKLKQYKMADEAMVNQLLQNFMGVDGEERREFVS
jgi:DNA gyrase subunit B